MSPLPLPPRIQGHLNLAGNTNRSLLFDKGLNTYSTTDWKLGGQAKKDFLLEFVSHFNGNFSEALARRREALAALGATSVDLTTASRLVIGLGLPHSVETGFLFDRLTGSPYLPGSSVKGLLRAAAELVRAGQLPGDTAFWAGEKVRRAFGPETGSPSGPAQGRMAFYDAFPTKWPKLEVDVLTPHHSEYYGAKGTPPPPGDWESPVPVAFLTIKSGTTFRFYFLSLEQDGQRTKDLDAVKCLLPLALDWLGIGGKKSAGYGYFEVPSEDSPRDTAKPAEGMGRPGPTTWQGAVLAWAKNTSTLTATNGRLRADTLDHEVIAQIPPPILETIKKGKKIVKAEVDVTPVGGNHFRILRVDTAGGTK